MDPAWMLPSLVDQNPLVLDGGGQRRAVDLRDMRASYSDWAYERV